MTVPENTAVATAATASAAVAEAVAKTPSKKSQALAIFNAKLTERLAGSYPTNKEFRAAVLSTIQADLGVSTASAATMYNAAKKDAEAAGTITLGRDPKKEKVAGTGKRGRPVGSKNKAKEGDGAAAPATVTVDTTEAAPAEAAPATDAPAEAALV